MARRIFIVGANGRVGSRVATCALMRGWSVAGLSRSGVNHALLGKTGEGRSALVDGVTWIKGDMLDRDCYREELRRCDGVVYSCGQLLSFDTWPLKTILQLAMAKNDVDHICYEQSWRKKNLDGAIAVAEVCQDIVQQRIVAEKKGGGTVEKFPFVYISIQGVDPHKRGLFAGYHETKLAAEAKLRALAYVDETILRPANFLDEEIFRKSEPRLIKFVR